ADRVAAPEDPVPRRPSEARVPGRRLGRRGVEPARPGSDRDALRAGDRHPSGLQGRRRAAARRGVRPLDAVSALVNRIRLVPTLLSVALATGAVACSHAEHEVDVSESLLGAPTKAQESYPVAHVLVKFDAEPEK